MKMIWSAHDIKVVQSNAKAMTMSYFAWDANEFNCVSRCSIAKHIWEKLKVTFEGSIQVKKSKISMLTQLYEIFTTNEGESIVDMLTRFTDIINTLKLLGKAYPQEELNQNI